MNKPLAAVEIKYLPLTYLMPVTLTFGTIQFQPIDYRPGNILIILCQFQSDKKSLHPKIRR